MSLLALYPEYVQIMVRKDSRIRRLRRLNGKNLYIGLPGSGTHDNATDILEALAIEYKDVKSFDNKELTTTGALALLREGFLDAVFSTSGGVIEDKGLRHFPVNKELANELKRRPEYYSLASVEVPGEGAVPLLSTQANLVARSPESPQGLSNRDARHIVKQIHENQLSLGKDVPADLDFFFRDRLVRRISHNIHPGAEDYFRSQDMLPHISWWEYVIITMSIFIGMTILFAKPFRNTKPVAGLLQTRPVIYLYTELSWFRKTWNIFLKLTCATIPRILTWLFAIIFVGVIYFIHFLEKKHSITYDLENPFAGIEFFDSTVWLLTFAITGFNQDIYPKYIDCSNPCSSRPDFRYYPCFLCLDNKDLQR